MVTGLEELNPAQSDAYNLLRQKMLTCLECVDDAVTPENHYDNEVVLAVAHNEIPRLIIALRGVVKDHKADANGRCQSCGYRKIGDSFEPTLWPCPVVNSVHAYVREPERFYQYCPDRDGFYA